MKKLRLHWMLILCFAFLLVYSFPMSAHASTHISTQTRMSTTSGGGCTPKVTQGPTSSFAQYASCIYFIGFLTQSYIGSDAYFNFGATSSALWTSCAVTIDVVDETTNTTVDTSSTDCLSDARVNATNAHYINDDRYGGSGGDNYVTEVTWRGIYDGKVIQGINLFSPVLFEN